MPEDKASYRQIFKATSLFGGVQVFNIILSIVRSKIIAVLLGPTGMGISGLLTSTTGFISSLTNFGLGTSAVKNIAAANETGNQKEIGKVVTILRRLVWGTGLLGMLATLVLSRWLSKITFGNNHYTIAFIWLSLTLLLNQLTSGQDVLLQGMRKLQSLAKANIFGSFLGLLISIPLYYFYGIDGIVPALIGTAVLSMVIAWYLAKKIEIDKVEVNLEEMVVEGKGMLRMGFLLSISSLISVGAAYLVRIYISNTGGMADVGLFNAGFSIIGTYVGLIFSAMATDFYPRLAGIAHDNKKATELINHQAEIAILILSPILCGFLIFINWVIILLYSKKFVPVTSMLHWAALGMYFKAASWSIAFILIAKGKSKFFFWNELVANLYILVLNIAGYKYLGLTGLGISFMVGYILYLIQVYFFCSKKYNFSFDFEFYKIYCIHFGLGLVAFLTMKLIALQQAYLLGLIILILSTYFSFKEMDRRLNVRNLFFTKYFKKINGK